MASVMMNVPLGIEWTVALACLALGFAIGYFARKRQTSVSQAPPESSTRNLSRERQVELQRAMLLVLQDASAECVHHAIAVTNALAAQFLSREQGKMGVVMDMKYLNETSAIAARMTKLRDKIADPAVRRLSDELVQQSRKTLRCNSVAEAKGVLKEIALSFDLLNQTIFRSLDSLERQQVAS